MGAKSQGATLRAKKRPLADDEPGYRHNGQTDKYTPKEMNRRFTTPIHGATSGARVRAIAGK